MAQLEQQFQSGVGQLQRASEREAQLVIEVTRLGAERTFVSPPAPVAASLDVDSRTLVGRTSSMARRPSEQTGKWS